MDLKRIFPILEWLPSYSKEQFRGDLPAGLTAGVLLIPQSIAFAMIAGVPPIYGLYASTIPMILYAIFGTCRQLSVGPVSIVSLLTFAGVSALATPNTMDYIKLTITLSLVVGLIQLLLGTFRLGFLVNFLSHPVISGFTSASAVIIAVGQLKHIFGIKLEKEAYVYQVIGGIFKHADQINWYAVGIGLTSIVLIVILKRIHKAIPAPLAAVIYGILVTWGFHLTNYGVKIVGTIPSGIPMPMVPPLEMSSLKALLPTALIIAMVSFVESIAIAKVMQNLHKDYKVRPNQELIALGIAKVGAAFFQAFPTTGGFSRTAVNEQAGARTGVASIISSLLVIFTIMFLTPLFYYLPNAALGAVIIIAVIRLIDLKEAKYLWRSDVADFIMMMVTFLGTLFIGIEEGIGIGVVLSLAVMIYRTTRPHLAVLGRIPQTNIYKNVNRFDNLEDRPDLLIIRFDAQLYFANISYFRNTLESLVARKGDELQAIIINAESINRIDSSGMHMLADLCDEYAAKGIQIYCTNVIGPVRDMMTRGSLVKKFGKQHFFMNVPDAVEYFDSKAKKEHFNKYIHQTNVKLGGDVTTK